MSLRVYDNYVLSDSFWGDMIPENWEVLRVKDVVEVNPTTSKELYIPIEYVEFLQMSNVDENHGVVKKYELELFERVKSGYTAFKNNDVLFAKITPCMENGNCIIVEGLKNNIGFGSTEFIVFRSVTQKLLKEYLHLFLRSASFLKRAEFFMVGAAGQKRIPSQFLKVYPFALPEVLEQKKIVDYLLGKKKSIDKKIELLEQKVEYYKELRKSIINETVCRGLDKNVALKDSGIEWIGKIPEHWEVKRGKDVFIERSQKGFPKEPLLAASQKYGVVRKEDLDTNSMTAQKDFENFKLVKVNDFVISLRSFEGGIEIAHVKGIISPVYTVFYTRDIIEPSYYRFLLKSDKFILFLRSVTTGIRDGKSVKYDEVKNMFFPILPCKEQLEISEFLVKKSNVIDGILDSIKKQIETLKELRKTLINDVVTGKLKVN